MPATNPYSIQDESDILTPALLIYRDIVDANIDAAITMAADDPNRWRPHIKTAKLAAVLRQLIAHGVPNFKCATTLELLTACEVGASDILLAFSVTGANARRVLEIAGRFPATRMSVLVESAEQALAWRDSGIGIFIDVNPGMNRTGIAQERIADIVQLARSLGPHFRGLHYYDGHMSGVEAPERESRTQAGYTQLLEITKELASAGVAIAEVITSGTPAAPFAISYPGFRHAPFVHRISPGTVVYNDFTSLDQLPGYGYAPAALVLTTVISHPAPSLITCDAGHKSVSVDAGVPNCSVIGHPSFKPRKPSEEHLPIEIPPGESVPQIGTKLYLLPRHVCPTVNNFDQALMVVNGRVQSIEPVSARGHENPFAAHPERLPDSVREPQAVRA